MEADNSVSRMPIGFFNWNAEMTYASAAEMLAPFVKMEENKEYGQMNLMDFKVMVFTFQENLKMSGLTEAYLIQQFSKSLNVIDEKMREQKEQLAMGLIQ